jgi:hypothetical protein
MSNKFKVVVSLLLIAFPACAFMPATHQRIAQQELLPYINGGAIAPDWCLAYDMAIGDEEIASHHDEFHSDTYVRMLRILAMNEERAFAEAYANHVEADKMNQDPPDTLRGESYIILCSELMVKAYKWTYPSSEWQPTVDEIETLYLANLAYQSTLPEIRDFDNVSELKELVNQYRELGYSAPSCIYHAQYFSWYAGQVGYNVSWLSIPKSKYNKLFDRITFPPDREIDRHYVNLCLVGKYEYLIDPQTGEIVKTKNWAVGK